MHKVEKRTVPMKGASDWMRILVDLGHASHYYLFKPVIASLRGKGDEVRLMVRDREGMVSKILDAEGEKYLLIGRSVKPGAIRKSFTLLINDLRVLRIASEFKPDVFLSMASPYSGFASFVLRRPHVIYTDTEVAKIIMLLVLPFTSTMITPSSFNTKFAIGNHVKTDGYKVIAYLHPSRFKPDPSVLQESGLSRGESFAMMRFSSYDASHDFGLAGLSLESRKKLVDAVSRISKVVISSEIGLDEDLRNYEYRLTPERILDLLSYASLYVGEGATMACEAALLGVPSIFIHRNTAGILEDLEREGALVSFHKPNEDIDKIISLSVAMLEDPSFKKKWEEKSRELFEKKEDPASVIVREIELFRRK